MNPMNILKVISTSIFLVAFSQPSGAVEPLTTGELSDLCKNYKNAPNSSQSMQCARYIKGFIDGAIAIDYRVASHIDPNKADADSFSDRAINNRIRNRLDRFSKPENNDFCLGRPLPLIDVIEKVTGDILKQEKAELPALFSVYKTLRNNYPCDTE